VRGIRDSGKTVFLTTHLMEEAERLCDHVAIIEHGKIVDIGAPQELVRRHCPTQTVVLATQDALAEERLRMIPSAQIVAPQDSYFTIQGDGDDFVSDVILFIREQHPSHRFSNRSAQPGR
jgi:ABC-2 type transport system ATP-binding protein